MSEYDKLDEFLKSKLQPREYEFKEAYWEAAEALIEADQLARKRRRRWFFFLLFGLLGMGGIIAATMNYSPDKPTIAQLHSNLDESICEDYSPTLFTSYQPVSQQKLPTSSNPSGDKNQLKEARASQTTATPGKTPPKLSQRSLLIPKSVKNTVEADPYQVSRGGPLTKRTKKRLSFSVSQLRGKGFSLFAQPDDSTLFLHSAKGNPLRRKHFISVSLGTNLTPGFKNNLTERAKLSLHPIVGAHYAYELQPGLRVQTGLLYQGRGGLNADTTFRSLTFSFGEETEATTISPQRLHYVEIPILFDMRVKGRHYFMVGANFSYLINASSKVNRERLLPFGSEDLGTSRAWGYKQGFNDFDAGIMVGYGYYLNHGLRIGVRGRYGLNDITNNDFFNNQFKDRNLQLKLILAYDLFHF